MRTLIYGSVGLLLVICAGVLLLLAREDGQLAVQLSLIMAGVSALIICGGVLEFYFFNKRADVYKARGETGPDE